MERDDGLQGTSHMLFPLAVHVFETRGWGFEKPAFMKSVEYDSRLGEDLWTDYHDNGTIGTFLWPWIHENIAGFITDMKLSIEPKDIWVQRYFNGAGMPMHRHHHRGWSGVFYADFDEKQHMGTTFQRPYLDPMDESNKDDLFCVPVKEGEVLVFPSWMSHCVLPNKAKDPRTIVSFNLVYE